MKLVSSDWKRIETDDGSFTYAHPIHGATYRNTAGARSESEYVFLGQTKLVERKSVWKVLELGFGTGLNFELTRQAALRAKVQLQYTSLDIAPMPSDLWLTEDSWRDIPLGETTTQANTSLTLLNSKWQDWTPQTALYHAIYHDPFGPTHSPDCWTEECFRWEAQALAPDGIIATFGASSSARQALKSAGLYVGSLPGALKKRQMTVASHCPEAISHAKAWKRS